MRILSAVLVACFVAASCAAAPNVVATEVTDPTPVADAVAPTPTPEPGTRPTNDETVDLVDHLLTATEVPGWNHSGPMDFPAEPTWEAEDCPLMNQAWAANAEPGTRTRGGVDGATFRNTVVEMADEAAAGAVLDAADVVWEECVQFSAGGGQFWSEPIEVPPAGWRSSGLVIGGDDFTWVIAYWQRDDVIVLLEIDGDATWDHVQSLLAAQAGRLLGEPAPVPPPAEPDPPSLGTPEPEMTPDPGEPREPDEIEPPLVDLDDWRTHPLAVHVPPASDIGPGWQINTAMISEYEPAEGSPELVECGLTEPPTLDGIDATYTSSEVDDEVLFVVNQGAPAEAQAYVELFRGLVDCGSEVFGFYDATMEITTETIEVAGADDAVVMRMRGWPDAASSSGTELLLDMEYVVARYEGLLFAMASGGFELTEPGTQLSIEQMVGLIEAAVSRG